MSKSELLEKCKEWNITKCSSKNKSQLIELIKSKQAIPKVDIVIDPSVEMNEIIRSIEVLPQTDTEIGGYHIQRCNYIDLCSGIGGFRLALESFQKKNTNIHFHCVLSADIKEDAIQTYNLNFHKNYKKTNIFDITPLKISTFEN